MVNEIYIIDNESELVARIANLFIDDQDYVFKHIVTSDIEVALKNIPSLIIINEDNIGMDIIDLCSVIQKNDDNGITPVIVLSSNQDRNHKLEVLKRDVEYFIKSPIDEEILQITIKNIIELLSRNRRTSPLTGLPGNVQIQTEMKKRLLKKEKFAVLYFDLDNFKAYNDVYGFSNGDEIIKFTARVISKNVHGIENSNNFIGHIGGDDFVSIIEPTDYDNLCKQIINEFDVGAATYYNEEDVDRGFVEVANRRGIIEQFPLTTISIAVVEADADRFNSPLEIGEVSAQVKHKAKTILGSTYVINKRKK